MDRTAAVSIGASAVPRLPPHRNNVMIMRSALTFVALLPLLFGCGGASNEQKNDATEMLVECMRRQADQLDDRKSDASTIAYAVSAACHAELQNLINTYEAGLTTIYYDQILERELEQETLTTATKIVLQERQGQP
jgi:hypothetical protein